MQKQIGFKNQTPCGDLKMPALCAWCGSPEVIGTYPVVVDRSRVTGLNFEFLKYEDCINNFQFPICSKCKQQIKFRRALDNRAIQVVVVFGILAAILLSLIYRNIGLSIFTGFVGSISLFGIYLLIKNITLSLLKQVSENSWGRYNDKEISFHIQEFGTQFNKLNRKRTPKKEKPMRWM